MFILPCRIHITAVCAISLLLSACGQKGDLYLVNPTTEAPTNMDSELVETLTTDVDAY